MALPCIPYLGFKATCLAFATHNPLCIKFIDMKSGVVMVAIVSIVDFIFMFLCLDLDLYIEGFFPFYMSHYIG